MAGRLVSMVVAFALAAAVAGCADKKPEPTADTNLYPKDYKSDIVNALRKLFEKNDTIKVSDAVISDPALRPVGSSQHYVSCVRYTAHGSQPGLIGQAERIAYFYGGELNQLIPAGDQCAGAAYKPFRELNELCLGKGCK